MKRAPYLAPEPEPESWAELAVGLRRSRRSLGRDRVRVRGAGGAGVTHRELDQVSLWIVLTLIFGGGFTFAWFATRRPK